MSEELLPAKAFPVEEIRPVTRGWILFSFLFYWLSFIGGLLCIALFAVLVWKSVPGEVGKSVETHLSQKMDSSGKDAKNDDASLKTADKGSLSGDCRSEQIPPGDKKGKAEKAVAEGFVVGAIFLFYGVILIPLFCGLPMLVVYLITLHRAWKCMQCLRVVSPGQAVDMDTPATAVGLLFCPYFNIYWMFPALLRLEKYGRILAVKRGMPYRGPVSSSITLFLIFNLCFFALPVIGWILYLFVAPFLWNSLMKKFNDMIEDLGKPGLIPLSE